MDRGVEGVSRGMRCQSDLEAAQEGRPFEGRDQESPSLCKTLCVWNPFFGLQSCEISGYIHTALSTILGKRSAVLRKRLF